MMDAYKLHQQAMDVAEQGDIARRRKQNAQAKRLFEKAFDLECRAALSFVNQPNAEPTRSVLLRSAAWLALDCGKLREAEQMIGLALSGTPPADIRSELLVALVQVTKNQLAKKNAESQALRKLFKDAFGRQKQKQTPKQKPVGKSIYKVIPVKAKASGPKTRHSVTASR